MKINCLSEYKKVLRELDKNKPVKNLFLRDSTSKFELIEMQKGNYPAIITINGFLSEDSINSNDWKASIKKSYPNNAWFHLEWNSQKMPFTKSQRKSKRHSEQKKEKKPSFWYIKNLLYINAPSLFLTKDLVFNNHWSLSLRNSKHCGVCLSEILNSCYEGKFLLIGHSLGARVIYHCLKQNVILRNKKNIVEVHLLGGAVSSSQRKWKSIESFSKLKIFNYYSSNDDVLKYLYKISMLNPNSIGLGSINLKNVENNDTSEIIKGHTDYISNFLKINR